MTLFLKSTLTVAAIFLLVMACTSTPEDPQQVSGYDRKHQFRSAKLLPPGTMCTEIFTEGEQYAADCQKAGFESHRIECHEYLCSGNLSRRK